jgi:TetR/AcrR family transcriptional repressor of mexJK operon
MGRPAIIQRERLLDTARRVFAHKGFESATLADIAREMQVTPAAVLRHYPSKQALFAAAMQPRRIEVPEFMFELASTDPASDPRIVLRRLAEQFVPFVQRTIAENLAVYMFSRAQTSIVLPFDPRDPDTPPRRGLEVVTEYFKRAEAAGVLRVRNPRAAALLFMGSLQSYVFIHQVLHVSPAYPLPDYIDALIDLWSEGAFGGSRARKKSETHRAAHRAADRGGGDVRVSARQAATARVDLLGNDRGPDGKRRVARRRPRNKSPRR